MEYAQLKRLIASTLFCLGLIAVALSFASTSSTANVTCGTVACEGCGTGLVFCNMMSCCDTDNLPCTGDDSWTQICYGEHWDVPVEQ